MHGTQTQIAMVPRQAPSVIAAMPLHSPLLPLQDEFAVQSHKKAAAAQAAGRFKDEIVPVSTKVRPLRGVYWLLPSEP